MGTALDTAVEAFRAGLLERDALHGAADDEARELGRRAALLVDGATSWRQHLGELLDVRAVMQLLGVGSRQAVYDLVARRRMLGIRRRSGSMVFPGFQFDPAATRPYPIIGEVLTAFADAGVDAYTVATWLATTQDELGGRSPRSLFTDPSETVHIIDAARRTASRLSH